jgi:PAS domain S-box-containing protein
MKAGEHPKGDILDEPEEIIRAIRNGEVDAFVVSGPLGEGIYSLRQADVLYRRMVEDMKEGAVALDDSGVVVYCNSYFAHLVGSQPSQIVGRSIFPFVTADSRAFFDALVPPSAEAVTSRQEIELKATGGQPVRVFATMNRIRVEDVEVFCLILRNLTEEKKREELLIHSRRKDEFLAMLAHELRNPLAPIRNAVDLLGLRHPVDDQLQWVRGVIDRQVTQLTRLVDDLLDVSRIATGKLNLETGTVDLAAVAAQAVETTRPFIETRKQQLVVNPPARPLRVHGDAARLGQIVSNLLHNAAKFTPDGGRIDMTLEERDGLAEIRVRDTGVGIAPEMLVRIFDLFAQESSGQGRTKGGLGIGLTLVRSLVEMQGGSVDVASDGRDQGSEFVVRLPLLSDATG